MNTSYIKKLKLSLATVNKLKANVIQTPTPNGVFVPYNQELAIKIAEEAKKNTNLLTSKLK